MGRLDEIDLTLRLGRDEYEQRLAAAQERFLKLRLELGGETNDGDIGPGCLSCICLFRRQEGCCLVKREQTKYGIPFRQSRWH